MNTQARASSLADFAPFGTDAYSYTQISTRGEMERNSELRSSYLFQPQIHFVCFVLQQLSGFVRGRMKGGMKKMIFQSALNSVCL